MALFIFRLDLKLPKGIRIKTSSRTSLEPSINVSSLDELYLKLKEQNIEIPNPNEENNDEDVETFIKNLKKRGLTITFHDTNKNGTGVPEKNGTKELVSYNISEALHLFEENQSNYEIEMLDYDSDMNDPKKHRNDSEFIKIRNTFYMCYLCFTKFESMKELTEHMNDPVPCSLIVFHCDICDKNFNRKSHLSSHMLIHKEKLLYYCDKCGECFNNTQKLNNHLEIMHTEYFDYIGTNFQCKRCDHTTLTRELMLQHINLKHLHISTLLCHICGKSFMTDVRLKVHIQTHRDTKSFLCQICSKSFKTSSSLTAHIKTHDQSKQFVCERCGKAFKKSNALRDHKKSHDDTYICVICDRCYESKFDLDEHIKSHL